MSMYWEQWWKGWSRMSGLVECIHSDVGYVCFLRVRVSFTWASPLTSVSQTTLYSELIFQKSNVHLHLWCSSIASYYFSLCALSDTSLISWSAFPLHHLLLFLFLCLHFSLSPCLEHAVCISDVLVISFLKPIHPLFFPLTPSFLSSP